MCIDRHKRQSISQSGGNDTSGYCDLYEQLQVYNHDMNTKDEAQEEAKNHIFQTINKNHVDISQMGDIKAGNDLKGKPLELGAEGFNMGSLKLNFSAEGNTELSSTGIYYDVSSGIPHKTDGSTAWVITFKKISGNLWMLDNSYFFVPDTDSHRPVFHTTRD